jgi:hypothetical protein
LYSRANRNQAKMPAAPQLNKNTRRNRSPRCSSTFNSPAAALRLRERRAAPELSTSVLAGLGAAEHHDAAAAQAGQVAGGAAAYENAHSSARRERRNPCQPSQRLENGAAFGQRFLHFAEPCSTVAGIAPSYHSPSDSRIVDFLNNVLWLNQ